MPLYKLPDGSDYTFDNDQEATEAMDAWEKQFGTKTSMGDRSTENLIEDYNNKGFFGRAASIVPGVLETGAQMLTGTPAFVTGTAGKVSSLLQGKISEEEMNQNAKDWTPEILHDITYDPRTVGGQLVSRGVGEAFHQTGKALAGTGVGLKAGLEAAIQGEGQSGAQRRFEEQYPKVTPITSLGLEAGMVGQIGHSGFTAFKKNQAAKKATELTEAEKVNAFEQEKLAKEKAKEEELTRPYTKEELQAEEINQMRNRGDLLAPQYGLGRKLNPDDVPTYRETPNGPDIPIEMKVERPPDSFGSSGMRVNDFGQTKQGILSDQFEINRTLNTNNAYQDGLTDLDAQMSQTPQAPQFGMGEIRTIPEDGMLGGDHAPPINPLGHPTIIRNERTSGLPLEFDPQTGKLKVQGQTGLKGASPDTIVDTSNDLSSAVDKMAKGAAFSLTARERIAWNSAKAELEIPSGWNVRKQATEIKEQLSGRSYFGETIVDSIGRNSKNGYPTVGQHNKGTGESTVSKEGVMNRWDRGLPEHLASFIKTPEDLAIFAAAHEVSHGKWKQGRIEADRDYEIRINKEAKKLFEKKKIELEKERLSIVEKRSAEPTLRPDLAEQAAKEGDTAPVLSESVGPDGIPIKNTEPTGFADRQLQLKLDDPTLDPRVGRADWQEQRKNNVRVRSMKPLKSGPGKQRGSIGFGKPKKPTIEEIAAKAGRPVTDPILKEYYEATYGEGIKVPLTPQQQAISNIPGMKQTFSPELQPLETMIERWKTEADVQVGKVLRALRENLSAGGRMTALKTGNSYIDWNVENILGEVRRAKVIAKNVNNEIRGEVKKITGSLMNNVLGKGEGKRIFVEAMGELMRVEGTPENPRLNPKAKVLAEKLRKGLNDLGEKVQAELDSQGIKGFKWRTNYLAGVFFGPYRSLVKNAAGETIGVVAGRTKSEASQAIDYIKVDMPDVTFDVVEYNPKFDSGQGNLSSRYGKASEVLELLRNQSEEAARFQENLSAYYGKVQANYLGYKHHIKSKKGVFGSEGNRIWASAAENAYDLLEGQLGVIDHGYQWLAEQKIMKDMDASMTNPDIHMPEAQRYVNEYLDHAFGRTEDFVKIVDVGMILSADAFGISPSSLKESLSILRNTALTSTIGVSAAFVISQGAQVLTSLPIAIGKARSDGIHGDAFGSFQKGLSEAWSHKDTLTGDAKWFHDYFTRNGTLEPNIIEHTFGKSVIPTNGMGIAGKIAAGTANAGLATMKAISETVGKLTIEAPEIYTRGPFVMSMAHYYRSAGLSLKEAAVRADKDASTIFVDYSPQERAMAFQRMGELGKFASTVSTFKLNNLNQWNTFIGKGGSKQALAALALTTWMTTGIFGMPFSDEIEYMMRAFQGMGSSWRTPREAMLQDFPPVATFGPLSYAPEMVGLPSVALHSKFNAGNVVPDDLKSMIYPLSDFYVKKITKTADYYKSGFGNREGASLAREFAPGNFKYFVDDYTSLKNKHGYIVDSNQLHDRSPDVYDRSEAETKAGKILGVASQREYIDKQVKQQMKAAQKAWTDSTSSKVEQTVAAYRNGDYERTKTLLREAAKYNPEAVKTIQEYIDSGIEAEAIPLSKKMTINAANAARNPHNVGVLQNFQKTQRNR